MERKEFGRKLAFMTSSFLFILCGECRISEMERSVIELGTAIKNHSGRMPHQRNEAKRNRAVCDSLE